MKIEYNTRDNVRVVDTIERNDGKLSYVCLWYKNINYFRWIYLDLLAHEEDSYQLFPYLNEWITLYNDEFDNLYYHLKTEKLLKEGIKAYSAHMAYKFSKHFLESTI
jgi:hypothetical protein